MAALDIASDPKKPNPLAQHPSRVQVPMPAQPQQPHLQRVANESERRTVR